MALAVISASCSSQTATSNRGNATSVKIEMNFGKPAKLQLANVSIEHFAGNMFQIVVHDKHGACQLAKIINSDLSPCIRENEGAHEREEIGTVVSRKDTAKQRKPPENSLLSEMHTSISAKQPPDVLLQAGRDQDEGDHGREKSGTVVLQKDTAKQHLPQENSLLSEIHMSISASQPPRSVLLQAGRDPSPRIEVASGVKETTAQQAATSAGMLSNTAAVVARRQLIDGPLSWGQLKTSCESSACDISNGGCTIVLSDDFIMGSYTSEISFSGKAITIWGQGKMRDASGGGRFFKGVGAGSFLELHDAVLQNGNAGNGSVSE